MDIRKIKQNASEAMAVAREPKKVILAFAVVMTLVALGMTLATMWLDNQISQTGGLANMGTRSVLSTIQTILPLAQSVFLLCWQLGYQSAVLRFARKQYADHTDLRTGFRLFGPLLRKSLLEGLVYSGLLIVASWLGSQIFVMTPFAAKAVEIISLRMESGAVSPEVLLEDPQVMEVMSSAMIPMLIIIGILYAVLAIPVSYRYRMSGYRLIDKPQEGGRAALRNSRFMMRGNCLSLLKLDLSFWWYYLLQALAMAVCYCDQYLPLFGVKLPFSETVGYFLFYGVYLVMQFAIMYYFRNPVEVAYASVYDSIRPQEQENSVVLGNIFDM